MRAAGKGGREKDQKDSAKKPPCARTYFSMGKGVVGMCPRPSQVVWDNNIVPAWAWGGICPMSVSHTGGRGWPQGQVAQGQAVPFGKVVAASCVCSAPALDRAGRSCGVSNISLNCVTVVNNTYSTASQDRANEHHTALQAVLPQGC